MKYFVAILLALASFNTYAALNKWVDSQGVVHYSDTPPPAHVKSETLRTPSATPTPGSESTPASAPAPAAPPKNIFERAADLKKEQKAKEEAAQKAAQEKEQADTKMKNCESARAQVLTLQNSPRVTVYDAKGEPSFLDDAARQQRMNEAQDAVGKFCN